MKKFDFSAIRKSIFLMLFMMIAFVGFSQGTDDFNSLQTSTSYQTVTSSDGWYCVNAAVNAVASTYTIGTCDRKYVVINGKTTAVGSITSPDLTGGCGTLSLSYGNVYSESNGVSFKIQVKNLTDEVLYETIVTKANSEVTKGETYNFTADVNQAGDFKIHIQNLSPSHNTGNKDRLAISCIEWTAYGTPAAVEAPTFTPVAGNYFAAQTVALASATEGANIYYTTDGTTPTIESLIYQGPIAVSENTTIKAIAILGEDESSVATANYVINIPVEVATIEAFKAAEHNDNTIYKINGDVKVLGQYDNKKYTFIQDMGQGTYAALCIFDNNGSNINAYNPGDVISGGVYGTYDLYHNLIEMNPVEGLPSAEGTPGEVIAPDVRTLANVSAYPDWFESKLVTIKELTFIKSQTFGTTAATRGVVAVNGDDTINVYNGWGAITGVEVSEGMTADVTGFISRYNDILEIIPRGSEDIVEVVGPAVAPWTATFEDATENSAWKIENETYSNKWYIGQAQGFDNNKLYISSNNGTTNKYVAEYSLVKASRAIVVPETGGVLSFDYRANGNDNDYVQVAIVKEGGNRTNLATLHGANDWTSATYTIAPDLAGEATLEFLWTNQAGNANQFPAAIDNVSLVASSCSQPTALQAAVEETTATISWTGDAEAYLLQYKLANHSEWYSVNTTENTLVLNNLQGNSNYNVRVQSVCGEDASAWVEGHFVVDCQNLIIDEEEVTFGNGTSTNNYHFPLSAYYYHSYTQQLFTEEELAAMGITAGSQMSAISFNYFWGTATTRPITIWLGTTTMTSLSSAFVPKDENFVQVYSNNCQDFSNSNENWVKLAFDQSFTYNGGSLVVAVLSNKENGECFTQYGSTSRFYLNSQQGKARYHSDDYNEITFDASGMPQSGYNRAVSSSDYRNNIKFDATVLTCGDVEACPAVTNVNVENITPNSAELSWNRGNESETNFKVEYYAEGSTDVVSVLVEDTAYTLSGLSQLTNYTVKVQALCGENNTSEPVEIEFATSGICPPVSDIQSSNASNTTTLTWTPGGEERAWLVQFKPAEAGDNEWISINVNALPTTTFGGLLATTAYEVRVKAICDPEDEENQSTWTNYEFTSGCAAFDVPFAETFDSYSMPTCWDVDGFRFSGGYAYSYDLDAWIMTPAINIPSDETTYLAFDVKGYGNFSVMASYRGTDASRFAEIYSGEIESGSNYTQVVVPMADNLKGRQVYFKIVNNADQYQYIDNLSVDYCPFVPANLTATHITENSAVLAWTADEAVNNFQVKVGENIIDVEGAKTYTLTGLDASTSYTFSVRTQCGEDSYGKWSAEAEFTTACPATSIPYIEGFEGYAYSSMPDCWDRYSESLYYEVGIETSSYNAHSGNNSLYFENYGSNNLYAVLPEMDEPLNALGIELYAKGYDYDYYYSYNEDASLEVGVVTDINDIAGSFVRWQTITPDWYEYGKYFVDFQNYTGTNGRIAFRVTSGNSYSYTYVYVDDITVMLLPTCGVPTIAVNGTTANITPSTIGEPASYDLKIGEETQTVPATETTFTITDVFTDLVYGNTYPMQVRAICGEGDTSEWSAAVDFTYEFAYTMEYGQTREITTCLGTLYDNGGPQGIYENYSNDVMVIYPASEYSVVRLQGNYSTELNYDKIYIYDGVGTGGTPIYNAISGSGYIDATSTTGALTVKFTSDVSGQNSGFALNISCEQLPTCGTPTLAVNGTTATITPSTIGEPASYELKIGNQIETVPATQTTFTITDVFTNLVYGNTYPMQARAICGEGDTSEWSAAVDFTYEFAYTMEYRQTREITTCLGTLYDNGGPQSDYQSSSNDVMVIYPASEYSVVRLQGNYSTESNYDKIYIYDGVGTEGTPIYNAISGSGYIDATSTTGALTVKFTSDGGVQYSGFALNISCELLPTCGTPSIASVVSGTNDATVTVAASEHAQSYEVVCVLHGEDIETGTPVAAEELTATITGLTPATQYDVYARAICSETDTSNWSDAYSFFTECAAYTLPYTENFDSYTSSTTVSSSTMPICWSRLFTGTSTSYGAGIYPSTSYSRSGANSLRFYNYGSGTSASYGDAYAILPEMAANINVLGMELYARKYSSSYSSNFEVGVVTDVNDPANSFVSVQTIAPTSTSYEKFEVSFAEYTGANGHIAFRMLKPSSTTYAYIDDITVDVIPTCGVPTLAVSGITATITPSTVAGTPESYEVQIGEEIQAVSGNSFTITDVFTDLVYGNTYSMQVRAICGEGDTSAWSAAVDFTYEVAYTMEYRQTREITTCLGTLYDNGGPQGNYQNNSNDVMVIYPASEYSVVRLQGNYSTESSWDKIYIYDGVGTEGTPIYNAISGSGYIDATSTTGALTVKFTSDGSGQYSGFALNISCKQVVFEKDLALNSIDPIAWACDQSDARVTINVENTGFADTITSFEARYVINTQAPVSETVNCNLAPGEKMSYTFNTTPVFEDGENTVHAIVDMEGDMQEENNYTDSITVSVLEPETVPYTPTLNAQLVNKGWNVVDANNDGITMNIKNDAIVYTFNDTLAANDWMFTPCIEMAAGSYNVYFDYKANSSLTETFEVYYGQGANVDAMTNNIAYLDFNNTDYETAMLTITVAEDGIYNFGFRAMSLAGNLGFNIANFKVYPVVDVTVTSGENGTVTPNGVVSVNYGENLNLAIVPNTMYHVAGVWVDDVQVMSEDPYNSNFMIYTLENVTEPHNVFVDYKLEYHIIKSVANYNPAYTDVPGEFIPAATDTLIDPDPVTVNFAAAPHYHLYSLEMAMMNEEDMVDVTADVVDNGDHTYSYLTPELVVANYYLKATFRRDTVAVNYLVNTGKGYADQSDVLAQGAQYATWWDYSVANDVNAVANIRPYTTGDAHSDYHIVNVNVNGQDMGVLDTYTFENIQQDQNIAIDFGYQVTTSIRNYVPTYLGSDEVRGTIAPDTQLVAEGYPTVITGTVQEHFHLYNLFVDGVDMIDQVVFDGYNYSLTIDSTIANYHIEAVVKIDTFGIHYNVMSGQGYADESDMLVAPAEYTTWINYGDDFMMNLAPGRGFSIGNVFVDGIDMFTANNYLFEYVIDEHYVDVTFVPNDYTITTNAYGHGTVSESMSFTYDPANPVNYEFTANAAEGYHISAVLVNDVEQDLTGITNTYTLPLNDVADNYVINAIFEINTYNMVSEASLGGTITPEGLQVVNHGTDLTYEIVADEGRYISSITIDGITVEYTQADNITNLPQQFTSINADHSISVTFAVKHFTITAEVNEEANHGTIDGVSSFSGEFSYGSNQTLNFIPEENYQVSDVVVDGQSVGAVASYEFVNITAEHNVVVSFAPVQYTLTATSNVPACTITPATTTVQAGSNVNYTLTVATGYHLLNVIANGEEVSVSGNAFTIANVQEDYEIFANFAPNYVTVTVEQPAHATITPGTMTYAYGATPSYVIVPEVGYNVTAVHAGNALVNVTYNNGIGSFTLNPVTADLTVTATTAIKTFTITATQSAHGTISPAAVQTVNYGGNVTYTITPDDYYEIVDVLVDGTSRGALSTYTFNNVTANHTIEAVFEAACMTPSRLTVVYVDTNSATLTWEGNANSYEVRYRAAGETNFTTQTVTTNTITLTGLTENTLYAWGVKANCTASMSSDWAESAFRTNAVIPPYVGISTADLSSIKVYSHLNNVYIVNENGIAIENVTIYNIFGAQVYTGKANNNPEIISLDVANGNYIVRLSTENGVGVYKLSIVR